MTFDVFCIYLSLISTWYCCWWLISKSWPLDPWPVSLLLKGMFQPEPDGWAARNMFFSSRQLGNTIAVVRKSMRQMSVFIHICSMKKMEVWNSQNSLLQKTECVHPPSLNCSLVELPKQKGFSTTVSTTRTKTICSKQLFFGGKQSQYCNQRWKIKEKLLSSSLPLTSAQMWIII